MSDYESERWRQAHASRVRKSRLPNRVHDARPVVELAGVATPVAYEDVLLFQNIDGTTVIGHAVIGAMKT